MGALLQPMTEDANEAMENSSYHEDKSRKYYDVDYHRSINNAKAADHYAIAANYFKKGHDTAAQFHLDKAERHADAAGD